MTGTQTIIGSMHERGLLFAPPILLAMMLSSCRQSAADKGPVDEGRTVPAAGLVKRAFADRDDFAGRAVTVSGMYGSTSRGATTQATIKDGDATIICRVTKDFESLPQGAPVVARGVIAFEDRLNPVNAKAVKYLVLRDCTIESTSAAPTPP